MRIFRLGQLTAEYLLHVQDRLAYDNELLKVTITSFQNVGHPAHDIVISR